MEENFMTLWKIFIFFSLLPSEIAWESTLLFLNFFLPAAEDEQQYRIIAVERKFSFNSCGGFALEGESEMRKGFFCTSRSKITEKFYFSGLSSEKFSSIYLTFGGVSLIFNAICGNDKIWIYFYYFLTVFKFLMYFSHPLRSKFTSPLVEFQWFLTRFVSFIKICLMNLFFGIF